MENVLGHVTKRPISVLFGTDRYVHLLTREFIEEGSSQWRLEQKAMDRCDYLRYERCEPKGCQKETNVISRNRC